MVDFEFSVIRGATAYELAFGRVFTGELAGGVRLSACLDPTRLVVSGSSTVSNFCFPI